MEEYCQGGLAVDLFVGGWGGGERSTGCAVAAVHSMHPDHGWAGVLSSLFGGVEVNY